MKRKTTKPTQVRLFDPRESSGYREAFKSVKKQAEKEARRDYYVLHREQICANQRKYYHKKRRQAKAREYYAEHREHLCELQRKCYKRRVRRNKLSQTWYGRLRLRIETLFDKSQKKKSK